MNMSSLKHCAFGRAEKLLKWNVVFALESSKEVLFLGQVCSHINKYIYILHIKEVSSVIF
jgi:hypothetical protein